MFVRLAVGTRSSLFRVPSRSFAKKKKMPGKKKVEEKQRLVLGRSTNNVKMGVVGMPNIGKSTFFNTLSELNVPAENYPFCTIDPAVCKVPVPDERFDFICDVVQPRSKMPAVLTVTDIAGLVKGASEGKGLGNAFLSHIDAVDGIFHMVRAFKKKDIEHVEGNVDPVRDLEIIGGELRMKDAKTAAARVEAQTKLCRNTKDKQEHQDLKTMQTALSILEEGKDIREHPWGNENIDCLNNIGFLTAKPIVYMANVSEKDFKRGGNKHFTAIKEWCTINSPGSPVIPFCAAAETKLRELEGDALMEYTEGKLKSVLPKIIQTGYHALNLVHYFTQGEDEVRAWSLKRNTTAPNAAAVIHNDFKKYFIKVDVMSYADFKEHGNERETAAAGLRKTKGKDYIVNDGDIVNFKHNAP